LQLERPNYLLELQERVLGSSPSLPSRIEDLYAAIYAFLQRAADSQRLRTSPYDLSQRVKRQSRPTDPRAHLIVGGDKQDNCTRVGTDLERDDGAWFTFTMTLKDGPAGTLELDAYSFQLCFPTGRTPPFLRFDLDAAHEGEGLRAHLHPGANDLRVPTPVMHPLELLELFVYQIR
jgi:hypothetical protein